MCGVCGVCKGRCSRTTLVNIFIDIWSLLQPNTLLQPSIPLQPSTLLQPKHPFLCLRIYLTHCSPPSPPHVNTHPPCLRPISAPPTPETPNSDPPPPPPPALPPSLPPLPPPLSPLPPTPPSLSLWPSAPYAVGQRPGPAGPLRAACMRARQRPGRQRGMVQRRVPRSAKGDADAAVGGAGRHGQGGGGGGGGRGDRGGGVKGATAAATAARTSGQPGEGGGGWGLRPLPLPGPLVNQVRGSVRTHTWRGLSQRSWPYLAKHAWQ